MRQVDGGQEAAGVPQRRDGSRSWHPNAPFLLGYHGTPRSGRCHSQDLQPQSSALESIDMLFFWWGGLGPQILAAAAAASWSALPRPKEAGGFLGRPMQVSPCFVTRALLA